MKKLLLVLSFMLMSQQSMADLLITTKKATDDRFIGIICKSANCDLITVVDDDGKEIGPYKLQDVVNHLRKVDYKKIYMTKTVLTEIGEILSSSGDKIENSTGTYANISKAVGVIGVALAVALAPVILPVTLTSDAIEFSRNVNKSMNKVVDKIVEATIKSGEEESRFYLSAKNLVRLKEVFDAQYAIEHNIK